MIRIASITSLVCMSLSLLILVGAAGVQNEDVAYPATVVCVVSGLVHIGIDFYRIWLWKRGR